MNRLYRILFFLSLGIFQSWLSFAQIPTPSGCLNPPAPLQIGGDFAFTTGDYTYLSAAITTVNVQLTQTLDPTLGTVFPGTSVGYIFDVNNTTNFFTDFINVSSYNITIPGEYWVAQSGQIASTKYHNCRKLTVFDVKEVTASANICGTSSITLTINDKNTTPSNNHSRYQIVWGDGSTQTVNMAGLTAPVVLSKNYISTNPIIVYGEYLDNLGNVVIASSQKTYTPTGSADLYIKQLERTTGGTGFSVEFEGYSAGVNYNVLVAEEGTTTWVNKGSFTNGTATLTGFDASKNYCFKIPFVDACLNSYETNTVCSIKLESDLKSSYEVELDWNLPQQPIGILNNVTLSKNEVGCGAACFQQPSLLSSVNFYYSGLDCSKKYEFQIETDYTITINGGLSKSVKILSEIEVVDPSTSPAPPAPPNAVVVSYISGASNSVSITIYETVLKAGYIFYRAEGASTNYVEIGRTLGVNSFIDPNVQPQSDYYCYKYAYVDQCGRVSATSDPYCTIFLGSNSANTLDWTQYVVPTTVSGTPVVYEVQVFRNNVPNAVQTTFNLTSDISTILANWAEPNIIFRIVATQTAKDRYGVVSPFTSYSNPFAFVLTPSIFIPNAFTPNGDGNNDVFYPHTRYAERVSLLIFDRWGSLLFEKTSDDPLQDWENSIGWDGKINGTDAPTGIYMYRVATVTGTGETTSKSGTLTLLR